MELPEKLKKEIEEVRSEKAYFPILKQGDWIGLKHGAVRQTMIGDSANPYLVIAFGIDTPENFVFLMQTDSTRFDLQSVVNNAYENLDNMEVEFDLSETLDNYVATASGRSFSSEAILSKKHMMQAHEVLDAKELYVSIPRRTGLMVISKDAPKEIMNKFLYLHSYAWNDDSYGNAPIVKDLFIVEDGTVVGSILLDSQD